MPDITDMQKFQDITNSSDDGGDYHTEDSEHLKEVSDSQGMQGLGIFDEKLSYYSWIQ